MEKHVSIKKTKTLPKGLDFDALRLQGIAYVQELSGDIWTDFNEHDPGVTLLEHLCYALTDLAYRAGFDIKDILYAEEGHGAASINNGFFLPVNILPTAPITPTDYRRLLIDQVGEIRNAWFDPIESHNREYKGLFRIRLQLAEGIDRTLRAEEVKKKVHTLIMANRNLCEDLEEIIVLHTEDLTFSAFVSIEADAFGEEVLARILHTIKQTLNPGIRYYSREELEAEGQSAEDIFDGPVPLHGFIKKEDLKSIPGSTTVPILREEIAKVPGVKLIEIRKIWKKGQRILGDEIIPSKDTALSLHPDLTESFGTDGSISLERNGVPVVINPRRTRQLLNTLSAKAKKDFQTKLDLSEPPIVSRKKKSDLSAYRSFQRLLPAVYGLGEEGLPATANRERRAQAAQLKAYLLIFEQFMADYLAQLAHVRDLFSITSEGGEDCSFEGHTATYFTRFPLDIPNVEQLYYHGQKEGASAEKIIDAINADLQRQSAACDPSDKRRNRFLDHLLARFGEIYNDDSLRFIEDQSQEEKHEALVKGKTAFLTKYPQLSRERSKAFNYSEEGWETENVSGLKKRVAMALNIAGEVGDKIPKYANRDLNPAPFLTNVTLRNTKDPEVKGIQLSFHTMLREGSKAGSYQIKKEGKKYQLQFQDKIAQGAAAGAKKVKKQGEVLITGTEKQCRDARDRLILHLQKINATGEGFYFLENILLRPSNTPGSILIFEAILPNGRGKTQLRSLVYTNESVLNDLSTDILVIGTHSANWALIADGKSWRMVLLKSDRPIMITGAYTSKETALQVGAELQKLCLNIRNQDPASINDYLRLETERFPGYDISPGFYSLRLSIIAPAWPALLQNQDFRQLFQQVVATNIPAHLSVDYYWLDPGEMTCFVPLFKKWLEAKKNTDKVKAQELSVQLIEFLQPDIIKTIERDNSHNKVNKKLPALLFKQLGESFGYSFLFPSADFSLIQGMPPEVAALLPGLKINSWKDLQKAAPNELASAIHKAGLPATRKQIRNWQKQATLARNERWTDLLRYQRRAINSGGQAPLSMANRTKVERALRETLKNRELVYERIQLWLNRLPASEIVPYPVLEFLIHTLGYSLILPEDDLKIFSCIDEAHEQALIDLKVKSWKGLSTMQDRSWEFVTQKLESEQDTTDLDTLRKEVKFALDGDWQALLDFQKPAKEAKIDFPPTALEQRISYHKEQMMAPVNPGTRRPLEENLRRRKSDQQNSVVPKALTNRLLKVLSYSDLLSDDNFRIFEGIGEQFDIELKKVGVTNWQRLARSLPKKLSQDLDRHLSVAVLRNIDEWIKQAKLAAAGKWEELVEWQRGPVTPQTDLNARTTALESGIRRWLDNNAESEDKAPVS